MSTEVTLANDPLKFFASQKKAREEEFAAQKEALSKLSDEELIAKKHGQVESSEIHVIAVQLLHERQKAREKKPHWSAIWGFWIAVFVGCAACIGAGFTILAYYK